MKVLLIQPGVKTQAHAFRMPAFPEPLALETLAAYLPEHEVRIVDLRIDDTLDSEIAEFGPDIVGVTALTTEVYDAYLALDRTRELLPNAVTVVGGIHASLMPRDFERPSVDQNGRPPCRYSSEVNRRASPRPTGCTHTSVFPEATRRKANQLPSGENSGRRSPSVPWGGSLRTSFSRVEIEIRTIRAGPQGFSDSE